jgi:hypothetical protein
MRLAGVAWGVFALFILFFALIAAAVNINVFGIFGAVALAAVVIVYVLLFRTPNLAVMALVTVLAGTLLVLSIVGYAGADPAFKDLSLWGVIVPPC